MSRVARSEMDQVAHKQASSSVFKALDVIDALAKAGRPVGLSELARTLGRPIPSVHRLLRTLELRDYVEAFDGRYRLTLKLFEIGSSVVDSIDVVAEARPVCAALCDDVDETVNMSVRSGVSAVYVMKLDSPRSVRLISRLGMHAPLHCTAMGKVLLAYAEPQVQRSLLQRMKLEPRTANTITTRAALRAELADVAARGYAVDREEFDDGLVCVAAGVFASSGEIVAAISITGPAARIRRSVWKRHGALVQDAGEQISRRLGYRPVGRRQRGGMAARLPGEVGA
jgi:DNA-binding IclR family transcriptional regulator